MRDIIGHGGGKSGSGQHTHYEATDSLHSTSYARVLDAVSEGEIAGLAKDLESVYLDGTPVKNADGTMNFKDVSIDFRAGTQTQDHIAGFPDIENEIGIGVELHSGTPWVRAISNLSLSAVRIIIGVPALSKADTINGDIGGYQIDYQIELSTDGGAYAIVLSNSFNGKTTTPYQRSARIDLPAASSGWSLRVTRLTANAGTSSIADTTNIISYTEVIDAKLRYPMTAVVGVQVDAKQFQNIPVRAYDLYGRIVQVPSNYDASARTYTGVWDGTFMPSWTSNPAWIFRDLVLNDRYGLGARISAAQVDKWALYSIARYCDEMVPNGKGGVEPRFACNAYLQSQKQAYAVLQDLASVFRGIAYWGAGSVIASADMPTDPVYVYTAANVIGGKFHRVGSSKKTRYTVALVSWNDPGDFYKAKVEYIEDADGIKRYGIQQVSMTAFGCSSQGQAQRVGRWALATSRFETGMISFDVGMDGAIALPGQIVRVADPSRMGSRNGGRIRAAAGRVVTLDKAPTINAGDALTVILPSGVSETKTVSSVSGDTVTVAADWSTLPLPESVWSVDSTALAAPTYKILSVAEKDAITYTITATQHEPGKFDFVDNNTVIIPGAETALDVSRQAAPSSVTIGSYTLSLQDVQKLVLSISCPVTPGAVGYQGAYRLGNGNWIDLPRQANPTFDVVDVLPGTYLAKISAVNSIGIASIETQSAPTAISVDGNSKNAAVLLTPTAESFHTDGAGVTDPASITFNATLIALDGPATFSIVGGTLTSITDTSAVLTFANMSGTSATVTASVTSLGATYTAARVVTRVQDGVEGKKNATIRLYKWSTSAPAAPAGTSTFTWATAANSAYTGGDGWAVAAPANPGTPLIRLYVAEVPLTVVASTTASSISYSAATISAWSQNGDTGASGLQAGTAIVYQWAATIPAGPTGAATFTWATNLFGAAPTGWSLAPASSPSPGYTLWAAKVALVDSASNTTTAFNWTSAAIAAAGYAGTNGAGGTAGLNNGIAYAYQRAASAPSGNPGAVTYDFNAGGISTATLANGWLKAIPAENGNPLYVTVASASANTSTAAIAAGSWSGAVVLTQKGADAATLDLTATAQAITFDGTGTASPASQTITLTAVLQNVSGTATFACTGYNSSGTSLGAITLGGSGNARTLTNALLGAAAYAVVTATLGALSDTTTVVRLTAGAAGGAGVSALAGYLTNEAVAVPSATDGSSPTLTGAAGSFKVFQGITDVTAGCTFAVVGSPLVTTSITSGGAYSVTAVGTWGSASLTTSVTYRATHTASAATIDQLLTITKAPAGAQGTAGLNVATVTIYQRNATGTSPAVPGATVTYTFAGGGVSGLNNGWSATPPAASGGKYLFATLATASATTATDTIATGEWATVQLLAQDGMEGSSYVTAYCASASLSTSTAPAATTGRTSLPAVNAGGITGTWTAAVPTIPTDQRLWQTDGIYNPATDAVAWSIPYVSSAKYGSLSAIVANMGALTINDTLTMASGGAIKYGTAAWSGTNPTGTGIVWTEKGVASVIAGAAQFRLNADGSASFGGALSGQVVTTANLVVGSKGSVLSDDPALEDVANAWTMDAGIVIGTNGMSVSGAAGPRFFSCASTGDAKAYSTRTWSINPAKTYSFTANLYAAPGNNREMFLWIDFYDSSGTQITGTGWGGAKSGYAFGGLLPSTGSFLRLGAQIGAGTTRAIPSNAATARIGIWFQYVGSGSGAATQLAQDLRLELAADATTISPNSVQTKHLAISAGGDISSGQTAYGVGNGFWIDGSGGGHGARMSIGNSATGQQLLVDPTNAVLTFNGGTLNNPTIVSGFAVSASSTVGGTYSNGATSFGTITLTASGGKTGYNYSWNITKIDGAGTGFQLSSYTSSSASVTCSLGATNQSATLAISVVITDANGQTITKNVGATISWGTGG